MNEDKEKRDYMTQQLIIDIVAEPRITTKLLKCLFVLNIIEQKGKATPQLRRIKTELTKIYSEIKKYKIISYRDALIEGHSAEYFGKDYDEKDPYNFKEDIEKINIKISKIIVEALAIAYAQLSETTITDYEKLLGGD